ncbi:hypothetical protein Goe26_00900 [Bacillus phage vB_BsuM-Goe26]|nr:hypothetical protein Goe26_00900 [Bacillus phage vB_BsuM-Goe26]
MTFKLYSMEVGNMSMYYYSRNLDNINKLADNTKAAAKKLLDYAEKNKLGVLIYETIRTEAQQRENVRKGASQTMKSYHLVGQALDFVPTKGYSSSVVDWNGYGSSTAKKFVAYAKKLGFEWGGDWKSFVDKPHLQFNYKGYGTDTFGKKAAAPSAPKSSSGSGSSKVSLPNRVIRVTKPITHGSDVLAIQKALSSLYFYPEKGAKNNGCDSYYGPKTANAVKRFQSVNGLVADGIYGPKTRAAILKKL